MAAAAYSDEEMYGDKVKKPDDQGDLSICVRSGTAKAVASGFMEAKFVEGQIIDISQMSIRDVLVNADKKVMQSIHIIYLYLIFKKDTEVFKTGFFLHFKICLI